MSDTTSKRQPLDFQATHFRAHFEEHVGLSLIEDEGYRKFVWPKGGLPQRLYLVNNDQAHRQLAGSPRAVLIGLGGGLLDEHKAEGRQGRTCAAMLLAEFLEVDQAPEYQVMLREALRADTHRDPDTGEIDRPHPMELPSLINALHLWSDLDDEAVYRKIRPILRAYRAMGLGRQLNSAQIDPVRRRVLVEYSHMDQTHAQGEPRFFYISEDHRSRLTKGSLKDDKPMVNVIVMPKWAPFDTLVKAYIVRTHWRRLWSGDKPKFVMVPTQDHLEEYFDRDDVVFVGIKGGQFGPDRKVRSVAKRLGVDNWKEYRAIIGAAMAYAQDPAAQKPFSLGRVVEALNVFGGSVKASQIYLLVSSLLYAHREKMRQTYTVCPEEFRAKLVKGEAQVIDDPEFYGDVKIAMVESENEAMANYVRSAGNDIVVVSSPNSVAVLTRTDDRDPESTARNIRAFRYVVDEIVRAEAAVAGVDNAELKQRLTVVEESFAKRAAFEAAKGLGDPGDRVLAGSDWWYLFMQGYGLMNGSQSIQRTKATPLSNMQVAEAVMTGVMRAHLTSS